MKRREIDIFGVLVGLVVGCILGFFLSTRININMPNDDDEVLAQVGNIYLLQIDKTSSPEIAQNTIKALKNKGLYTVAVLDGNNYYIYGGLAGTENELVNLQNSYSTIGYSSIIKKEYILDKPNVVIEDTATFNFYTECIANLLNSLNGDAIEISDATKANPSNLELFSAILAISTIQNEDLLKEVRLSIYEMIIESLE